MQIFCMKRLAHCLLIKLTQPRHKLTLAHLQMKKLRHILSEARQGEIKVGWLQLTISCTSCVSDGSVTNINTQRDEL